MLLIRRRRPIGDPADAERGPDGGPAGPSAARILDGTAGAGRICAALLELGLPLAGVRQAVIDPDATIEALDGIDVGDRFERVALASHLVNAPEAARRRAFVRLAVRHLADGGSLMLEHHPLDWAETAADVPATPGSAVGMVAVRRHAPFVSAVSLFGIGGHLVRQPFTARVLSDAELADELAAAGLVVRRRLSPTWLEAAPGA